MTTQTRKEIEAHLISLFVRARNEGMSWNAAHAAVRAQCPGVPEVVLTLAAVHADEAETEAWWETMEKTIDGEVIARALGRQA